MPLLKNSLKLHPWKYLSAAIVLLAAGLYFHHGQKPAKTAIAVTLVTAKQGDLTPQITTIGTAMATDQVAIKSQVTGQLAKIPVVAGQSVKAGDTLLVIDPAPFQAVLAQAQALQIKDQAQAYFTQQQLSRYSRLATAGYVSKDFFAQILANAKTAKASVSADKAAVSTAALQLSHCTITAPISGRLGDILPHIGDLIIANGTDTLVSIRQSTPIDVQFSLPAKDLPLIRTALHNPTVHVLATASDDPQLHASGIIDFIDNQIDPTTGSILMKARFSNQDASIWPGQLLQITVSGISEHQVVLIPSEALNQDQQGQFYVYRVDDKNRVHLTHVKLGASNDTTTAVLQGLTPGARIVTQGQFRLSDGASVEVA